MTDHITTSKCDDCGDRAPGVMHHSHGAPTLFLCKHCSPKPFESVARQDIDAWLKGDDGGE